MIKLQEICKKTANIPKTVASEAGKFFGVYSSLHNYLVDLKKKDIKEVDITLKKTDGLFNDGDRKKYVVSIESDIGRLKIFEGSVEPFWAEAMSNYVHRKFPHLKSEPSNYEKALDRAFVAGKYMKRHGVEAKANNQPYEKVIFECRSPTVDPRKVCGVAIAMASTDRN